MKSLCLSLVLLFLGSALADNVVCVVRPGASLESVQMVLDWICGQGGLNCAPIRPGGQYFFPNTTFNHAGWAFHQFYLKYNLNELACHLNGVGQLVGLNKDVVTPTFEFTQQFAKTFDTPTGWWHHDTPTERRHRDGDDINIQIGSTPTENVRFRGWRYQDTATDSNGLFTDSSSDSSSSDSSSDSSPSDSSSDSSSSDSSSDSSSSDSSSDSSTDSDFPSLDVQKFEGERRFERERRTRHNHLHRHAHRNMRNTERRHRDRDDINIHLGNIPTENVHFRGWRHQDTATDSNDFFTDSSSDSSSDLSDFPSLNIQKFEGERRFDRERRMRHNHLHRHAHRNMRNKHLAYTPITINDHTPTFQRETPTERYSQQLEKFHYRQNLEHRM